jgi:glucose/arabinose dehydrogenase
MKELINFIFLLLIKFYFMHVNIFKYAAAVAVVFLLVGCAGNASEKKAENDPSKTTSSPTVKTSGNYTPAFKGQTRIDSVKTITSYKVATIAEHLGRPWAVVPFPGNKLIVTDRSGFMQLLDVSGKVLKKITGFPAVEDYGQGGLLDVTPDPDFEKNKTIYWSFSEKNGEGNCTAVAKGQLNDNDSVIKNPVVIFRALPALKSENHFGSRLVFDKNGYLFVTSGERSILEGRKQAQFLNSGLGKVFRITKEGKAAPGNPFIGQADAMPEIYSYGHRNPQSLDINPVTGDVWEGEFGPRGGDEINIIKPGKNYGWPTITYGIEYDGNKVGEGIQQKEGMEQPVYFWDPVLSPGGMVFYTGDAIPEWKNNLFIGGLSSMHLARLVIKDNKIIGEESLLADKKQRIRDVAQLNGKLYVVTDSGILYMISKN